MTAKPPTSDRRIEALNAIAEAIESVARAYGDVGSILTVREVQGTDQPQIVTETGPGATPGASGDSRTLGDVDGFPADPWPFLPGDTVHSNGPTTPAEWLDDAPVGTVVRDRDGVLWTRRVETGRFPYHWAAPGDKNLAISEFLVYRGPMTVVSVAAETKHQTKEAP